MRNSKRRYHQQQSASRSAEQQQPNQKQDVVRTDQNVVDTLWHELLDDSHDSLTCAREVMGFGMRAVENPLRREGITFIDVHECLMNGIVRKHRRVDRYRADFGCAALAESQPDRLTLAQNLGHTPFGIQLRAVYLESRS